MPTTRVKGIRLPRSFISASVVNSVTIFRVQPNMFEVPQTRMKFSVISVHTILVTRLPIIILVVQRNRLTSGYLEGRWELAG